MIWERRTACCMTSSLAAEDGLQHNTCMFDEFRIHQMYQLNFYVFSSTGKYCLCRNGMQVLLAMKGFSAP